MCRWISGGRMMRIEEQSKKRCAGAAGAKFCAQSCSSYFSRSFARALSFRSGVRFVINMSTASLQSMSVVVGQGLSREWAGGTWSLGGRGEGRTEEIREKEERVANRRAMCLRPACHPPPLERRDWSCPIKCGGRANHMKYGSCCSVSAHCPRPR